MADALFHFGDFPRCQSRTQPYIPGLLFKSRMENIGPWIGAGHSNSATETIKTVITIMAITVTVTATTLKATTVMETRSTASRVMRAPISYALEHRRQEPHGFIGNSSHIRISGCRR